MWPYKHNPDNPQAFLQILQSVVDTFFASFLRNFFPRSAPVQCLNTADHTHRKIFSYIQRGKLTIVLASHNYYTAITKTLLVSGFRRKLDEICALLGNYAAYCGNSLPTFRDNPLVSSSRSLKTGPIGCPETSARNYHYTLTNNPEECRSRKL